jgi:hypothetical protein
MVRVYKTFGKNNKVDSTSWKDAWLYICAALDGSWGTSNFSSIFKLYSSGSLTMWKSSIFTATTSSINLNIPIVSNEGYVVYVDNLTQNTVSMVKVQSGTSNITLNLTNGDEYYIHSSQFE